MIFNEVKDSERDRMQCIDRLVHMLHYMLISESLDGDVVEMGVYDGGTAMLMSLLTIKDVYLYDSFQGFPAEDTKGKVIEISLKYFHGEPVIREIVRISKPGLRVYSSVKSMPVYKNNMGVSIVSTSKGVMTNFKAKEINIGGEVLCRVY